MLLSRLEKVEVNTKGLALYIMFVVVVVVVVPALL
jgi:hypothetical protein